MQRIRKGDEVVVTAGRDKGTLSLPMGIATPRTLAVDLSYGDAAIPFLAWARGARCAQARQIGSDKLADVSQRIADLQCIEATLAQLVDRCAAARGKVSCPLIASLQVPA